MSEIKRIKLKSFSEVPRLFTGIAEYEGGAIEWFEEGVLHRVDGPAHISNIQTMWCRSGYLHRDNGPAIIKMDGAKGWYLNGIEVSPMEIFENLSDEEKEEVIWNLDEWK